MRGIALGHRCDTGTGPVVGAVVGHNDLPIGRHSWADSARSWSSSHGIPLRTGTMTLISGGSFAPCFVRHPDVLHDRC